MFKVTNRNDFDFRSMYAGTTYHFPVGQTVACEDDAAVHIFGIGDPNKVTYIARHGWVAPDQPAQPGLDILDKFKFERVVPHLDVPLATDAHGAAPVVQEPGAAGGGADVSTTPAPGTSGLRGQSLPGAR